jgi:hypothetical protein
MKKFALILVSCAVSSVAFAHGDVLDMTAASVAQGLKQLEADHPEHVEHFQGVKAWPVGADIKLKIYLPDNVTMGYTCVHDDTIPGENKVKCTMEM